MLKDGMGVELMDDIQSLGLTMPVMMVTADDDQETMRECFERGIDDYLLKPLNFELLWLKLQRLFSAYQTRLKVDQQAATVQALLDEKQNEEQLARHVYEHMVKQSFNADQYVRSLLMSSSAFNGDTFIVNKAPNGNICMVLMDATGHGLAAAISILPATSEFLSLVSQGLELSSIVFKLNQRLNETLPDDRFIAAIVIDIDLENNRLDIWNGGMPEVLMINNQGQLVAESPSNNMPLGILDNDQFGADIQSYDVSKGGHLVFCSDGLLEQTNSRRQSFGKVKLKDILEASNPSQFIQDIKREFGKFIGQESQLDDVSVCHLDINKLLASRDESVQIVRQKQGQVQLNLSLQGAQLEVFDVLKSIESFMTQAHVPIELKQKAFTVCAELVVNAIEHGVLGLDSSLKTEEYGFAQFSELRDARMQALGSDDSIKLSVSYDSLKGEVSFRIWDSGPGYDRDKAIMESQKILSGRGISLVERLSSKVHYAREINQTSVIIK